MPGCTQQVKLAVTDLTGPGLGGQTMIPAAEFQMNPVGYVADLSPASRANGSVPIRSC